MALQKQEKPSMLIRTLLIVGALLLSIDSPASAQDQITIVFQVTSDGLITTSIPMVEKKMHVPQGTRVKLVFHYADSNRNAHQFNVVSSKTELVSARLAPDGAKVALLRFTAGEHGEAFYRLSCELPCIAMEQLTDYLLLVDHKES
jgi:hypothetical protein